MSKTVMVIVRMYSNIDFKSLLGILYLKGKCQHLCGYPESGFGFNCLQKKKKLSRGGVTVGPFVCCVVVDEVVRVWE